MAAIEADSDRKTILLVEDDAAHAELVVRTFEGRPDPVRIEHLRDGEAALDFLNSCIDKSGEAPRALPDLVLLDLRLPKVDGMELLRHIKSSAALRHLPVVILTTSDADRDVSGAYAAHANGYIVKPDEFSRFSELMSDVSDFWLKWNLGSESVGMSDDDS